MTSVAYNASSLLQLPLLIFAELFDAANQFEFVVVDASHAYTIPTHSLV